MAAPLGANITQVPIYRNWKEGCDVSDLPDLSLLPGSSVRALSLPPTGPGGGLRKKTWNLFIHQSSSEFGSGCLNVTAELLANRTVNPDVFSISLPLTVYSEK